MEKEKNWLPQEIKDRMAEEIFQIFKREDLTTGDAWHVCEELKSRLIYLAFENKINYEGQSGEVQQISYPEDKDTKSVVSKMPLRVTVKLDLYDLDALPEIAKKVDKLGNGHLTDTHFIIGG